MIGWKAGLVWVAALGLAPQEAKPEWTVLELELLHSLSIKRLGSPPADPSNRFADDLAAAALGKALFSDERLSSNGRVSCASCHQATNYFTDLLPLASGVGTGSRRTMPIPQALYSPWQFWDGRADSLWSQALGPIENPVEHNFTRIEVARLLLTHYRPQYEPIFGMLPDLSDSRRFPTRASPVGDSEVRAAWTGMTAADREAVNRIYSNVGKTIAAFERTLRVEPSRFDRYVAKLAGDDQWVEPLSRVEVRGLRLFVGKGNCVSCHSGPLLSNQSFANTGVAARSELPSDAGRAVGAAIARADPFNCKGAYSDAEPTQCEELEFMVIGDPRQKRAFKVPSLRGVSRRPPFMHAGQYQTLEQVIDHYDRAPTAPHGRSELQSLHLTRGERADLVAYLRTLE